jgi:heme-binding uptake protein ChaN (Tiki superfamily)
MTYSKKRLREVTALKRAAVKKIQNDIGELDASPSRKYIEEFNREFQTFQAVSTTDEILQQARQANLIWIGDYHALSKSQIYAAEFVKKQSSDNRRIVLAVEPVFSRSQKILDRWMAGKISEQEFLERTRYKVEWGCDWDGYKAIFETARDLNIPVHGIDCHPRNDMRSIGRRDLGAAHRIVRLIEENPSRTVVVIFGESHLASNHLPGKVHSILSKKGLARTELTVLQNVDTIYWDLQEQGIDANAVKVINGTYCVFNATPIEKYESFRRYLHTCVEDDACGDWTPLAQTLTEVMMDFLAVKKADSVVSHIPTPESLDMNAATEEFARFIHQACRGELEKPAERTPNDQFFVSVIENALGYFCSKLLDSSRDGIEPLAARVLNQFGHDDQLVRSVTRLVDPARRPGMQHFEFLRAAVEAKAARQKTMRMLSQLLGYALGRRLYLAYLHSRISRTEIREIFHDPLNTPNRPLECYKQLTYI